MERLTARNKDYTWYANCAGCPSPDYGFYCTNCNEAARQCNRLADYEDTGLSPEDIKKIKKNWGEIACLL